MECSSKLNVPHLKIIFPFLCYMSNDKWQLRYGKIKFRTATFSNEGNGSILSRKLKEMQSVPYQSKHKVLGRFQRMNNKILNIVKFRDHDTFMSISRVKFFR